MRKLVFVLVGVFALGLTACSASMALPPRPELGIGTNEGQPECGDATKSVPVRFRRCASATES